MEPYSDEELRKSVYYPACGFDFTPILTFSHISNLFIYADWNTPPKKASQKLMEYCEKVNQYLAPDSLELIKENYNRDVELFMEGRCFIFKRTPTRLTNLLPHINKLLSIYKLITTRDPKLPNNFVMNQGEKERFMQGPYRINTPFKAWVREFILHKTVGKCESIIKLLYIGVEGMTTYCVCYDSGNIAPKVLITVQGGRGLVKGFGTLEDPKGIMAHFLCECNEKPLLWVRGGMLEPNPGPLPENPDDGLYNNFVKYYEGWNEAVAASTTDGVDLPDGFLNNKWSERTDFSDLLEISVS